MDSLLDIRAASDHETEPQTFFSLSHLDVTIFVEHILMSLEIWEIHLFFTLCHAKNCPWTSNLLCDRRLWRLVCEKKFGKYSSLHGKSMPVLGSDLGLRWCSTEYRNFVGLARHKHRFESGVVVVRGDISRVRTLEGHAVECIAFPTNSYILPIGVGAAQAIFDAAGDDLTRYVDNLLGKTGNIRVTQSLPTPAFNIGVTHLLHVVGPSTNYRGRRQQLANTYANLLESAQALKSKTLTIASISTGQLRFPLESAAAVAMQSIRGFLKFNDSFYKIGIVCNDITVFEAFTVARKNAIDQFCEPLWTPMHENFQTKPTDVELVSIG